MKERLVDAVGKKLDSLEVVIDDVYVVEESGEKTLTVVLDSSVKIIDLKTVVQATRILNPIIDTLDFIEGPYTLDVYAKEKGEESHE